MSVSVKILGVAWSPRHGNTEIQVREALKAAEEVSNVDTDYFTIVGRRIEPCDSCYRCFQKPNPAKPCPAFNDPEDCFDDLVKLINEADGIIFGNPVYYMTVTAQLKAFMDRSMGVEALGYPWRNKVAGFLTVAFDRNGGQEHTIRDMQTWAMMHDMLVVSVGPERPSKGIGGYLGAMACQGFPYPVSSSKPNGVCAIREDEIGMYATKCVGWRVAEMAKVVKAGFGQMGENDTKWPKGGTTLEMVEGWEKQ